MASYRGHIMFSSMLGVGYGGMGAITLGLDWGPAFLGAGLTALGGLMPDLDSDSSVPVRELFSLAAVVVPLLLVRRLHETGLTPEQIIVLMAGVYLLIRYGAAYVFKHYTVHRGMFHSIPAMLIAGLLVFLGMHHAPSNERFYLAGGAMLGFLSHLVLDELYAVDFLGRRIHGNKYAGTALKFWSPSWSATLTAYAILAALGLRAWVELGT
jgi:hypothetical protein